MMTETTDMSMAEIRFALRDRRISLVAKATGLTRQAIYDVLNSKVENMRVDNYRRLVAYLTQKPPAPKRVRVR